MRKAPLAGQSHRRVFGNPDGASCSFRPWTAVTRCVPRAPIPTRETRGPCAGVSLTPTASSPAAPATSWHLHTPGSLKEVMVLSHPTCHRNHWAMKYCRRARCVCPWDLTSEAKACACSLQGIKSTCSTARGLTEINMNIATTCADSGIFITRAGDKTEGIHMWCKLLQIRLQRQPWCYTRTRGLCAVCSLWGKLYQHLAQAHTLESLP